MSNKYSDAFGFAVDICRALLVVGCVAVTLLAAEIYLTNGDMLADAEIANGCAQPV